MNAIAVFTRNHPAYLESACAVSGKDPSQLITFRSAVRWTRAKKALDEQKIVQLYLAPIGSKGTVEYEATLKALVLDPATVDSETKKALAYELPDTSSEGLWGPDSDVRTLYSISNCRRLPVPFSITQLRKASDSQPISEDYGYSYVPVFELDDAVATEIHPEEIAQAALYVEGAVRRVAVNAYERNPAARKQCLAHYGVNCAVCGFNFGFTYGHVAEGFTHVHHLTPLATVKEEYQVDAVADLRPVCPNCHAVLHLRTPPFAIEELNAIIKTKG